MIKAYKKYFHNYHTLRGCASQGDYWFVFLANLLIFIVWAILQCVANDYNSSCYIVLNVLGLAWWLFNICPMFCLSVRRFHDVGMSGWWRAITWIFGASVIIKFLPSNPNSKYRLH